MARYSVLSSAPGVQAPVFFSGNVGILSGGALTLNNTTIRGEVDYAGSIKHSVSGTWAIVNGEFGNVASVATAQTDAQNLAAAIAGLSGTPTADITSSQTFAAGVYDVSKISLGSNTVLTLSGSASDVFIFRISGGFAMNAGQIAVSGGAVSNNVFFYYTGGSDVNFQTSSQFAGVLILNSSSSHSIGWNGARGTGYLINLTAGKVNFTNGSFDGPPAVGISPSSAVLYAGQSQQFTATVTNSGNTGLTWSLSANAPGTLTSTGLYTAPATIATRQDITVTATSQADTTKFASATVTLMPPVTVTVAPGMAELIGGGTQQFTATVTNTSNTAVTWSLPAGAPGTISSTGLYTAPAIVGGSQAVTVTATSQADNTTIGTATVTLVPVSVTVTPATAGLYGGGTQQFTAIIKGTNNTAVTWSIPSGAPGSISASGLYTAPAIVTAPQTIAITATSVADPTKSGTATETLSPPITVSVTPQTATLYGGGSQQFTADVINTNDTRVTWSVTPEGAGTISASGLYSAPAVIGTQQVATITATSMADSTKSAAATVTLAPVSVTVAPPTAVLYGGQTQQFTATVTNTANALVSWTVTPATGAGIISASGLYTAPATILASQAVTVTATSQADPTKWAAVTVTLSPPPSVTLTPASVALFGGQTQQFSASVANAANTAVTWTMAPPTGAGTIAANGLYTAPAVISSQTTVTITATSQFDTMKSASTTVTLVPVSLTLAPLSAILYGGQTAQFTAAVANATNTAVNWSISPADAGSIGASGLYTAPANITARQSVTITAISQADATKSATASVTLSPPVSVTVAPGTVSLYGGQTQQFTATVLNTANGAVSWEIRPVGAGTISASGLYTAPVSITSQQAVTIVATSQADSAKSATATVTLQVGYTLSLSPQTAGPNVPNTTQTLTAVLKTTGGAPVAGASVTLTVAGANPATLTATTDTTGSASFTYTGAHQGQDTLQASYGGIVSNTATVTWVTPVQSISTTTVYSLFFTSNGSCAFNTSPSATPAFGLLLPTVNVNPPTGVVPGAPSSIGINTRPMVDVITDINGNYVGSVTLEGNGYQAGVGALYNFQAVFFGSFTVAAPGDVTFSFFTDDGFIFGVGGGATRVSGAWTNVPSSHLTPFSNYPVMGALNDMTWGGPVGRTVTVHFPAAGTYPYELDYQECLGGQLAVTMASGVSTAKGVPPSGALALSPPSVSSATVGQPQAFDLTVRDASGAPIPNIVVALEISGANSRQVNATTDGAGHARFTYTGTNAGTDSVQALAIVSGMVAISNAVTVPWTAAPAPPPGEPPPYLNVTVTGTMELTLPDPATYTATATDPRLPAGSAISYSWSQVSGPAAATFTAPQKAATSVTFPLPGTYTLQVTATDSLASQTLQVGPVTVHAAQPGNLSTGWLGSPANGRQVTGQVAITVAAGKTLAGGTLVFYPTANPNVATILNGNTTGSGTLATLDTTLLPNGSYYILLEATDTSGKTMGSGVEILVGGDYKPGRVTTTVTDLVVPAPGMPIQIQRTYDSLTRSASGDFGNGWSLGVNVQLDVSPSHDVTLTLNGQRRTFYFTPYVPGYQLSDTMFVPNILGIYFAAYTPEPGLFGTLQVSNTGCVLDWIVRSGNVYFCYGNAGMYGPELYIYTDPYGRVYTIGGDGGLKSIQDPAGNTLTVTAGGIVASNGLSTPFVRDAQGRITQITFTDPVTSRTNVYAYGYDTNGDLKTVTYPGVSTPAQYTYDATHRYTGGTDPLGHALPATTYYPDGKLQSVKDALGQTTSYVYDLTTRTTTITYPDAGRATLVYDPYGKLLRSTDPLGHTTVNVYDANHNLTSVTDPLNQATTYTYDARGNRTSVTYPKTATSANTTSRTVYNAYGEPTQTTDELGNTRSFTYDGNFWPKLASDSLGPVVSFQFNPNGTMASKAVGYDLSATSGKSTSYTYDQYGNLASETDALGRTTTYVYDSLGRLQSKTPPAPTPATSYTYDALGHVKTVTAPLGRSTSYTYDANGNKTAETDANGKTTAYEYDALNRLTKVTYPTTPATTILYTYDFRNNVIDTTDQAGRVTHNVYDLAGRLTSVTTAYGTAEAATAAYTYYDDGRKKTETDAGGHATTYNYDVAGRLTSVVDAQSHPTSYTYDDAGNQTSVTDAKLHKTQQEYDARRRLKKTTYQDGTTTQYGYDGPGNLASVTDQAGKVVQYTYDAANQLSSVVQVNHPDASHNTTSYGYDSNGNLTTLTDANSHTTQNAFDALNQLKTETMPSGTLTQTRTYDPAGNLISLTDYKGKTTTYTYDALNRLLTKTPDSSLNEIGVTFTYTATGKRSTMTDASGTTTYTYDNQDRLKTKATPQGTLTYTYDAAGNLASMGSSNANGVSVGYTWDNLNRLSTVVDYRLPAGQNTTTYTYDAANNLGTVTYPNGLSSTFQYDDLNRLKSVNGYQYQLGPTGSRQAATEPNGRTLNWAYDGIYRLTNETISLDPHSKNGGVTYGLDPVGNRLSQTSTLPGISTGSATFDANDRLSTETYDKNGNTIVSGARTFAYDFENRLKSMNNGAVTITYDGDGNRVAKTAGGVTTRYLVEDLNPTGFSQVVEEIVGGAVQRTYTYGRERINENQLISSAWAPSFYGYDGGGSVRQLTSSNGAVTDSYDYDAWGNAINTTGSTPNAYLYRGERYDSDLSLYYLRARYFSPETGRFLTTDTYKGRVKEPITLHQYLYGYGDPIGNDDPSGHGKGITTALMLSSMILRVAPVIEKAGLMARGQLSLGINAAMRAGYWWDQFFESDAIRARMNALASGVFQDLATGKFINATAITANRWTPALRSAVSAAEAAGEEMLVEIEWAGYPATKTLGTGAYHAEQILLEWAKARGYAILSIAPAAKTACEQYCYDALKIASDLQLQRLGFPIFFY